MPRFAANLSMMFNELPFLERFGAARRAGFEAVEFLFPYEHEVDDLRRAVEAAGVEVVLFNLPPGDWAAGDRGMAVDPARAGEFRASIATALSYAVPLGVKRLHVMAGKVAAHDTDARRRYCAALGEAADAADAHGIEVLIEPLNPRDMPGYFLNDFGMAAGIISEMGRSNLKLQFDIYHRQILHGDVTKGLEALLPITGHIQTASVPLRQEPGTGELDDARIFALVDRLGYAGHIGCEYRPAAGTEAGLGWMQALVAGH
jgi:hydroxypyruvate isomerase